MKQFVFSKNLKRVLRTFLFLSVSLMLFSACSDDETYTGRLSVVFNEWKPEWTDRTVIVVTPIDNEDKILNMQKAVRDSKHIIELNPGIILLPLKDTETGMVILGLKSMCKFKLVKRQSSR